MCWNIWMVYSILYLYLHLSYNNLVVDSVVIPPKQLLAVFPRTKYPGVVDSESLKVGCKKKPAQVTVTTRDYSICLFSVCIWSNYSDPKWWWKVREMGPLISGKSRWRWNTIPFGQMYIIIYYIYMSVSKYRGTPKSSILIGFSIINHPIRGTPIFCFSYMNLLIFWDASYPSWNLKLLKNQWLVGPT